jgi:hypothetical protein
MNFKPGDKITYNSGGGFKEATIRSIRNSPNGRNGIIPWLFITVGPTDRNPFPEYTQLPADPASLKMYDVKLA